MKKNNLFYTTACVASLSAAASFAATGSDATAADVANGTLDVKLKVSELVRLSGLNEINLGTYDPAATNPVTGLDEFCVYYNHGTGVSILLESTNGGSGTFSMAGVGTPANTIDYVVGVSLSPSTTQPYAAHAEGGAVVYATANTAADDACVTVGADTTGISVTLAKTGLLGVGSDDYIDTIKIKISPNP